MRPWLRGDSAPQNSRLLPGNLPGVVKQAILAGQLPVTQICWDAESGSCPFQAKEIASEAT